MAILANTDVLSASLVTPPLLKLTACKQSRGFAGFAVEDVSVPQIVLAPVSRPIAITCPPDHSCAAAVGECQSGPSVLRDLTWIMRALDCRLIMKLHRTTLASMAQRDDST